MEIPKDKKIYFSSDNHLGLPSLNESHDREKIFVKWLDSIKRDAEIIFLLGDLFDFWFEYKEAVPRGFTRSLGKLAELSDMGIKIYFFLGNHDYWMTDYFQKELNIKVFKSPELFIFNSKSFFIGHGDGLGPRDISYKLIKKVFKNPIAKKLFQILHPDLGIRMGQFLSLKNKWKSGGNEMKYLGEDKELLIQYSKRKLKQRHRDYFIFGHRHLPLNVRLDKNSTYINLGDWITHFTYGVFDGRKLELKKWEQM